MKASAFEQAIDGSDLVEFLAGKSRTVPALEWLTGSARDLVRIAVCLAGFDARTLVGALARIRGTGERLNTRTVERVLEEIRSADAIALVVWFLAVRSRCEDCDDLISPDPIVNPYTTCFHCTHWRLQP